MGKVRDEKGRFVKGHPNLNKDGGRPPKRVERLFMRILREEMGEEKWRKVVGWLVQVATGELPGRVPFKERLRAAELLIAYDSGKPTQAVDIGLRRLPDDVKEIIEGEEE